MRMLRILSIPVVAFAMGCAQGGDAPPAEDEPAAADEYPGAVSADPAHYAVEFENDAIRLLRITYGPGETSVMHHHPPNCSIALGEASWRMTDPAGAVTEDSATLGEVQCGDEASVHMPENTGTEASELLLVELKADATAGTAAAPEHPHAVAADPEHYTVEWENDVVRIVRVHYGPGETSVMHSHPANCVVWLRDQPSTFELPSGEVTEVPRNETGATMCADQEAHLPTNTGDGELEVVLVELKARAMIGG